VQPDVEHERRELPAVGCGRLARSQRTTTA
jgi:hypothetical protein